MSRSSQLLSKLSIIPRTSDHRQVPDWQRQLAEAFTDPRRLLAHLGLAPEQFGDCAGAQQTFSLRAPRYYVDLMEHGNPADPLLRQIMPSAQELVATPGYDQDPVGDLAAGLRPGLIQKYQGRALLISTPACAVHCRYCFRRHYPYAEQQVTGTRLRQVVDDIACRPDIEEVILSGGDPLLLNDQRLQDWLERLSSPRQIKRLRLHSRTPIVLPQRITPGLVELLKQPGPDKILVLHANHAREITAELRRALAPLRDSAVTLLNQSVLLAGVNDDIDRLTDLSKALFDVGVLPYYLHQLDRVAGAAHFAVADDRAIALHQALLAGLPGYLVPKLVRELPGEPSKRPLVRKNGTSGSDIPFGRKNFGS